jgi:hypothetical protein
MTNEYNQNQENQEDTLPPAPATGVNFAMEAQPPAGGGGAGAPPGQPAAAGAGAGPAAAGGSPAQAAAGGGPPGPEAQPAGAPGGGGGAREPEAQAFVNQPHQFRVGVDLGRGRRNANPEILAWALIKRTTEALSFNNYKNVMDAVLCNDHEAIAKLDDIDFDTDNTSNQIRELSHRRHLPFTDADAYRLLKVATEAFVTVSSGVPPDSFLDSLDPDSYASLLDQFDAADPLVGATRVDDWWSTYLIAVNGATPGHWALPYLVQIRERLRDLPIKRNIFVLQEPQPTETEERCYGILADKLLQPLMLELIWSYWHEEGMLVQTMGALGRRFQNVRGPAERDPLAMVELDPLRPLNNLLWGYIQDEQHRLSVIRRAYEYSHHYGLKLEGRAIPAMRPADPRNRFLAAFHFLLYQCSQFFRQDDDTTVVADGFPVLNALRELHLVLSEGAHNQFGDLPTTARIEMLMEQWLLARPELREFLPRRIMVAYPEPWMDSVDSMKRLQGWDDTSIIDFNYLATDGERLLLSVRYTNWTQINDAQLAGVWARMFRDDIQRYIHSYRSVTGVDLTAPIRTTQDRELIATAPSDLIQSRLKSGRRPATLPPPRTVPGLRERRAARQVRPS